MSAKHEGGAGSWVDPDDAPELDEAFFAKAEIRQGERVVRRGRPKAEKPKVQVTLRLDQDVVEKFRSTGAGWQSRINETLRGGYAVMGPRGSHRAMGATMKEQVSTSTAAKQRGGAVQVGPSKPAPGSLLKKR